MTTEPYRDRSSIGARSPNGWTPKAPRPGLACARDEHCELGAARRRTTAYGGGAAVRPPVPFAARPSERSMPEFSDARLDRRKEVCPLVAPRPPQCRDAWNAESSHRSLAPAQASPAGGSGLLLFDGGGPAAEEVERFVRFGAGLSCEGQEVQAGVGGELHHLEGEGQLADDRVVEALGAGLVQAHVGCAAQRARNSSLRVRARRSGRSSRVVRARTMSFGRLGVVSGDELSRAARTRGTTRVRRARRAPPRGAAGALATGCSARSRTPRTSSRSLPARLAEPRALRCRRRALFVSGMALPDRDERMSGCASHPVAAGDATRRRALGSTAMPSPPADLPWLQPYPDGFSNRSPRPRREPGAVVVPGRRGIELAFIAAIQHLPPRHAPCSSSATSSGGLPRTRPRSSTPLLAIRN